MMRGDWLRLVAQTLIISEGTVRLVYRQSTETGLIATGPRGTNSRPLDLRERKDFLEMLALCIASGRIAGARERASQLDITVRWSEAGLHAEKLGGIRVSVLVPQAALSTLLALD
jgi:transposase